MQRRFGFAWAVIGLLVGGVGCVWTPRHNAGMASRAEPVKINAYALKASATIKVECGHHWGGWEQVGTFAASATSTVLWGDTMYPASSSVSLPDDCWESAAEGFQTFLRFQQSTSDGDFYMRVFDKQGQSCVLQNGPAQGAIDAGFDCSRSENWIRITAPY
jgi:hypothetical protein